MRLAFGDCKYQADAQDAHLPTKRARSDEAAPPRVADSGICYGQNDYACATYTLGVAPFLRNERHGKTLENPTKVVRSASTHAGGPPCVLGAERYPRHASAIPEGHPARRHPHA